MSKKKLKGAAKKEEAVENEGVHRARMALSSEMRAAATVEAFSKQFGDIELPELVRGLHEQIKKASNGDLSTYEGVLAAQANALDAIFNNLARRAMASDYLDQFGGYLKLALRAQAQSRATIGALAALKNPPIVGYVKQANISHGPQQVNNFSTPPSKPPSGKEKVELKNELLEKTDGERLDTGAAGTAGCNDPEMATVGKIYRAEDSRR